MPEQELRIRIKQIEPGDKLTGLSLGHADYQPLKTFIQKHALIYERQSLARTYGAFRSDNGKLAGYITLVCGEVVVDDDDAPLVEDDGLKYLYNHYPAIKIARLAVHKELKSNGLGQYLVELALGTAKNVICPAVGCRFVMVDSKVSSVSFYRDKCGFTFLDTPANRERSAPVLFVDLAKA